MKLIFHGDDFGLTSGVNRGIIRSFREGLLTSTSMIAAGEAAQEAISLVKDTPGLDMGVHLTLCDERPVLRPRHLSSIIPSGGRFPSRIHLLKTILFRRIDYREVEAEWRAQVETVLNAGIRISHLDSHQFVHLFPGLIGVCLRIIRTYDIPFVRGIMVDPASLKSGLRRLIQWAGLAGWSRLYASRVLAPPVKIIPSMGFLSAGGRLTRAALLHTLTRLQANLSAPTMEIILHPGTGDAHTIHTYCHWGYDWKKDLDLLTDGALKQDLARQGMQLTSFGKER
ncbi:MAG: ChbG/HpnK family deacetylase [Deltaproteobacteria bacterium]|nr:ChbG/HpnK family deacetylase [Deltaproteobacteria bacterium]